MPGAPPRTSTPPVVPSCARIAVQPVGRSRQREVPDLDPLDVGQALAAPVGSRSVARRGLRDAAARATAPAAAADRSLVPQARANGGDAPEFHESLAHSSRPRPEPAESRNPSSEPSRNCTSPPAE